MKNAMVGCLKVVGFVFAFVVLSIGGCAVYFMSQPKNVAYSDVLTSSNSSTYKDHHASDMDIDAVQRSITYLGPNATGRTFQNLYELDKKRQNDKHLARLHEQIISWRKSCSPGDVRDDENGSRLTCSARYDSAQAVSVFRACWDPVLKRLDGVVQDQRNFKNAVASGSADATSWLAQARSDAQNGKNFADDHTRCPGVFEKTLSAASHYFADEDFYLNMEVNALDGDQASAQQLPKISDAMDGEMLNVSAEMISAKTVLGVPLRVIQ